MSVEDNASVPDGIAFDGKRFKVRLRTLPTPMGGVSRYEIIDTPDAAAIVPILARGGGAEPLVVLVEQERPAIGRHTLEIPAGLINPGETPEQTARRELTEETGYVAGRLRPLTSIHSSPGIMTELLHIYLASELTLTGQAAQPIDTTEIARLHTMPLHEAVAQATRGEISDAKTVVGLLLARDALAGEGAYPARQSDPGGADMTPTMDPRNPPWPQNGGPVTGAPSTGGNLDPKLSLENILSQEFNYASVTAYQAMEDRARIFGLYLTLVGVLAAALGAVSQLSSTKQYVLPLATFLLLLAGGLGTVFFTQLVQVRRAWFESALAMNRIKEYYIEHLRESVRDVDKAFKWRLKTLPRAEKRGTITHLVCYTTAFLGSLAYGLCVLLAGVIIGQQSWLQKDAQSAVPGMGQPQADALVYGGFGLLSLAVVLIALQLHNRYYRTKLNALQRAHEIAEQEAIFAS